MFSIRQVRFPAVDSTTLVIALVGFYLLYHAAGVLAWWPSLATSPLSGPEPLRAAAYQGFIAWKLMLPLVVIPLLARRRWAWAASLGVLQVYLLSGLVLGISVVMLAARQASRLPGGLWPQLTGDFSWIGSLFFWLGLALVPLPLCLMLSRSRASFGVAPGQGFRALIREGGPALLLTALLEWGQTGPALHDLFDRHVH